MSDNENIVEPPVTPPAPIPDNNGAISVSETYSLDDLIPEDIRSAVYEEEASAVSIDVEGRDAVVEEEVVSVEQPVADVKLASSEEDIDISPDSIDKLLDGDLSAVTKTPEEENTAPAWHEEEFYKELLEKTQYAGLDQEKVDGLIQKVLDENVLDTGNFTKGLQTQVENHKRREELLTSEVERLKEIEKAAYFDRSDEVQTEFAQPMQNSAGEVKRILDIEAPAVNLNNILLAKNKNEFMSLVKDIDFSEGVLTQLSNHWRNYKDTEFRYNTAKQTAQQDLKKGLKTGVPEDIASNILKSGLRDFIKQDDKHKYINEAINDGIEKHEDVTNVLADAHSIYNSHLKVFDNPLDYAHDSEYLAKLAKFSLESAHNKNLAKQFHPVNEENGQLKATLAKVVKRYQEIANSAKGISGVKSSGRGSISVGGVSKRKQIEKEDKEIAETYEKLLRNEINVDSIILGE